MAAAEEGLSLEMRAAIDAYARGISRVLGLSGPAAVLPTTEVRTATG